MRATVPTEAQAILRLIKNAGPRVHLAFEEGTQAQWLHDLVAPPEKVVACNTRGQNGSGNKNDGATQVRRQPVGPARALLDVTSRAPRVVEKALTGAARRITNFGHPPDVGLSHQWVPVLPFASLDVDTCFAISS